MAFAALALILASCGNEPQESAPAASTEPAPAAESMGRAMPDAGGVTRVTIKARGVGGNEQVAIDRAIRLAFEQVNGKSFTAATASLDSEFYAKFGSFSADGGVKGFADAVVSATSGAVSEFRILQSNKTEDGYEVLIEAALHGHHQRRSRSPPRCCALRSPRSELPVRRFRSAEKLSPLTTCRAW